MKTKTNLVLTLVLLAGCGETTGRRVSLKTRAASDLGADRTFVTGQGWSVKLDAAAIAPGAFYYFDGEPAFTEARPQGALQTVLAALSPIQTAWAHPGHYSAGIVLGQQLSPYSIDLLGGEVALPDGEGVTGAFRSASF